MKKNTRELLLDSAFQTFYKQGLQGVNIATVLSDVDINKGSMYYFFKSKKELELAVVKVYITFEKLIMNILEKENISDANSKVKLIIANCEGALMIYHLNQNRVEFRAILTASESKID